MYRVLIAEDEEIIRRGVCGALCWKEVGCELCGAVENGAEAIRSIQSAPPDILLCDIRMPEKSGLDVAQFIQENRIDCKVLLLTGYSDFSYAQLAITFGVFDYLLKPVSTEALKAAIFRATSALDEARQLHLSNLSANVPTAVLSTAAEKLLSQFIFEKTPPSSPLVSRAKALGLSAERFSLALIPFVPAPGDDYSGESGMPPERRHLISRLFDNAAQRAAFHSILPETGGVVPLCAGYSEGAFSPFYCWEILSADFCHEAHIDLPLAVCAHSSDLIGLHSACQTALSALSDAPPAFPPSRSPVVLSVLNYLWAHYASPVKLANVADHVYLNPSYISRIVHKETGMSFVDHLLFIRVQEAKRILLTSRARTFEVAEMTGFGSVKYFSQVFRQLTGMSPSQYRSRAGL